MHTPATTSPPHRSSKSPTFRYIIRIIMQKKLLTGLGVLAAIILLLLVFMSYYAQKRPCSNAGRLFGNCQE